ncbi:hypothetical protein ENBRE01_1482 [Enteropsectra breve]|nr:hypothetical protein ENBRE01_1482 [Enteropsectra breve]
MIKSSLLCNRKTIHLPNNRDKNSRKVPGFCFCTGLRPSEQKRHENEYFMRGLDPLTHMEIAKLDLYERELIIEYIQRVEESVSRFPIQSYEIPRANQSQPQSTELKNTNANARPLHYCKRHGNCLHKTEDCLALKKGLPPRDPKVSSGVNKYNSAYVNKYNSAYVNKYNSAYVNFLCVPQPNINKLVLKGTINHQNELFQLDPGAKVSCISFEEALCLKLPYFPAYSPQQRISRSQKYFVNSVFLFI